MVIIISLKNQRIIEVLNKNQSEFGVKKIDFSSVLKLIISLLIYAEQKELLFVINTIRFELSYLSLKND